MRDYGKFHVGLKLLLWKDAEILFLTDQIHDLYDLPGGRIDNVEYETPLTEVIAREVHEELGGTEPKTFDLDPNKFKNQEEYLAFKTYFDALKA